MYEWQKSKIEFVKLPEVDWVTDASSQIKVNETRQTWIRLDRITKFYEVEPDIMVIEPFGTFRISEEKFIKMLEGKNE